MIGLRIHFRSHGLRLYIGPHDECEVTFRGQTLTLLGDQLLAWITAALSTAELTAQLQRDELPPRPLFKLGPPSRELKHKWRVERRQRRRGSTSA